MKKYLALLVALVSIGCCLGQNSLPPSSIERETVRIQTGTTGTGVFVRNLPGTQRWVQFRFKLGAYNPVGGAHLAIGVDAALYDPNGNQFLKAVGNGFVVGASDLCGPEIRVIVERYHPNTQQLSPETCSPALDRTQVYTVLATTDNQLVRFQLFNEAGVTLHTAAVPIDPVLHTDRGIFLIPVGLPGVNGAYELIEFTAGHRE